MGRPGEVANPAQSGKPVLLFELGVLFAESVDATGSIHKTLLAGEEGMAVGADFHMHIFALGGKGFNLEPACAR